MDDYTNKYKGEQVEVALFGGDVLGLADTRRLASAARDHARAFGCEQRCGGPADTASRAVHQARASCQAEVQGRLV